MEVYKVAVCENNINILNQLSNTIENYYLEHNIRVEIYKYNSGEDFLDSIKSINYNIIFMDIDLGSYNGVKIIEKLRYTKSTAQVIFITSYSEYKVQVLSLHTFDYIVKPFSKNKVISLLDELSFWLSREKNDKGTQFTFKTTVGVVLIDIKDILYFEYVGRKIEIITTYKKFSMYGSLKELIPKLSDYGFTSPHASYLVNLEHIQLLTKDRSIQMNNNQLIPIAQTKQKEFRKIYFSYIT